MTTKRSVIPPKMLLQAYSMGIFPMAPSEDSTEIHWFEPHHRGILPIEEFHVSKEVRRLLRNRAHEVWINRDFASVIRECGNREETWISDVIIQSMTNLHDLGFAHSLEIYNSEDELVGGQYGVALGGAFFGESMFQREKEMHKFALFYTAQHLRNQRFTLWDTQYYTPHLGRFGGQEISQSEYLSRLEDALPIRTTFSGRQPRCLKPMVNH